MERRTGPNSETAPVVLAVSGGGDSLALMLAAARLREEARVPVASFHVVTVDHRLRPESASEAAFVRDLAARLGFGHETCVWQDGARRGNLSARAREGRYNLLQGVAQRIGARLICTGHHLGDQFETHLMARARQAGPIGLAGMRVCRSMTPQTSLLRPFLDVPGEVLKEAVAAAGIQAVNDPTNDDPSYERVRTRRSIALDPASQTDLRRSLDEARSRRARIDAAIVDALNRLRRSSDLRLGRDGTIALQTGIFSELEQPAAFVLLRRLISAVSGSERLPRPDAILDLLSRLSARSLERPSTLGGAVLSASSSERLRLHREFGRQGLAPIRVDGQSMFLFDGRFEVDLRDHVGSRDARLVAFGTLGRGNPVEATLPVLAEGRMIIACHPDLVMKLPDDTPQLRLVSRLEWRLYRDLGG